MSQRDQGILDFLRALWDLLREFFAWVRDGWQQVADRVAGLEWKFEAFAIAALIAVVLMPLAHAWITRPRK